MSNAKYVAGFHQPPPALPTLPDDLSHATAQGMVDIEKYIKILYDNLERVSEQFRHCGTFACGQDTSYL